MPATPDSEPTLTDVIDRLDQLSHEIGQVRQELKAEIIRQDDRFFQLSRDNLGTARAIIVTAGTVVILSPVLQALAPAIKALVNQFFAV
ncbi:MAG: hypothetical protein F6K31_31015 [Symploca sp. SIO2G7]|nr:hypothetical protein [Symploca sp. SIO2G7]